MKADKFDIRLSEFIQAAERIKNNINRTPMDHSSTFSDICDAEIYLKCENLQKTGSFKIRGAANKIAKLVEEGNVGAIVTASAGNHAQGVACAASMHHIPSTIVMPAKAPIAKIEATKGYGAKVVLSGNCYDDAYEEACRICETEKAVFVHPYNDPDVITGQGTLALEIINELPDVDIVLVPVGGGGLLSGIATAIRKINPAIQVYGIQAEKANAFSNSFKYDQIIKTETANTIADGIAVKSPGDIPFELAKRYADGFVEVSELELAEAVLLLLERCKLMVEPSGASTLAAAINQKVDLKGKKVVCLLSGGNMDVTLADRIITMGMIARKRWIAFDVIISNRNADSKKMYDIIIKSGARILSFEHNHYYPNLPADHAAVHLEIELRGQEHAEDLMKQLRQHFHLLNEQ